VIINEGHKKLEHTLTVKNATKANDGYYACYGVYHDAHFAAVATLKVIGKFFTPFIFVTNYISCSPWLINNFLLYNGADHHPVFVKLVGRCHSTTSKLNFQLCLTKIKCSGNFS